MEVRYLKLLNFRNYKLAEFNFSSKFNLIYGKNGMGKTNLVEAIYVLALTKSFRTNNDKILISKDQQILRIEGIIKTNTDNKFKLIMNNEGKKAKINDTKIAKLSDYISKMSVILFNPDNLKMIKDSPSTRRKLLNIELSQLNNQYLKYLNNYNKVLKQRNAYLKTLYLNKTASIDYLDILTNELVKLGEHIFIIRKKFFTLIEKYISDIFYKITNTEYLKVKYVSDFDDFDKEKILKKYKSLENKDIMFGKTSFGIHLDDYIFSINDDNLKDFGSEGQQKNAIIAFRLAELEIFNELNDNYPILILDDLFSELDKEKIENILNLLNKDIQIFITTTEIDNISEKIIKISKKFEVENGLVREEHEK